MNEMTYKIKISNIESILKIGSGFKTGMSNRFELWLEDAQLRIVPGHFTINITYPAVCYTKELGHSHIVHNSQLYMLWVVRLQLRLCSTCCSVKLKNTVDTIQYLLCVTFYISCCFGGLTSKS